MPNYEYMHNCLRTWGEALYSREQYKRPFGSTNPFFTDRGLTKAENISEKAFVMTCMGMAQAERVFGRKLVETFSDAAPMEAWRRAFHRNSYRKDLKAFDTLLQETLAKPSGRDIAIGSFPGAYDAGIVKNALRSIGHTPTFVSIDQVVELIDMAAERIARRPIIDGPSP